MIQINCSINDMKIFKYERMNHLHPRVQQRMHTFEGVVHSTSPFVGVNIVDRESEYDSFSTSSHSVSFSTMETNGEDGLDLVVANDGIITFELNIDSIPIPHLVKIGAGDNVPTSLPLPLITKEADVINQIGRPSYTAAQNVGYYLWQDADNGEGRAIHD
ncbi:MAG: hypothetical protein LWX55_14130 [Deltaproteobacteria bacterium]|jgi:hypothetical protein|nr:hypothetical protein [Deltaproteobacteria bacterium]